MDMKDEDLFFITEEFIRKERECYLEKKRELAHIGDIQGALLIDRDVQTMEIIARKLRRFLEK